MDVEHLDGVIDLPRIPEGFAFEDDQLSADYYQLSRDCPEGIQLTCQSESCSVAAQLLNQARKQLLEFSQHNVGADDGHDLHEIASHIDDLQPVIDITCLPGECFRGRHWQRMCNAKPLMLDMMQSF